MVLCYADVAVATIAQSGPPGQVMPNAGGA